jgi:hypothetical protein
MSKARTYRGWNIERGAYQGTTDDRLDRWYVQHPDRDVIDRRGPGFATLAEARAAIDEGEG